MPLSLHTLTLSPNHNRPAGGLRLRERLRLRSAGRLLLLIVLLYSALRTPHSALAGTGAWLFGTNVFANASGSGGVEINFKPLSNHVVLPNGALMRTYPVTIITSNSSGSIGSNYFVAGPYRVSTPETIDTFTVIVPSDEGAYDWVTLSTNSFNFITNMTPAFILVNQGSGSSNVLTAPRLRPLGFSTNVPGQVWSAVGTNGAGAWSNALAGSGSGDVTTAQLNNASNILYGFSAIGISAATATNIAEYFATNSALVTSNALLTIIVANDTTTSNALRTLLIANDTITSNGAVAFTMSASNNLAALLVANDTFTSNALRTLLIANDTITSNGCVAFTMTASNSLAVLLAANDITTSNGAVAFAMTVSNAVVTSARSELNTASNILWSAASSSGGSTNALTNSVVNMPANAVPVLSDRTRVIDSHVTIDPATTNLTTHTLTAIEASFDIFYVGDLVVTNSVTAASYTNTSLPTNAFMRIGPGGIMTTGIVGSGLSLSPGGTLSATATAGDALVTNVVSLSASNATSKPVLRGVVDRTAQLFGLEAGANITVTPVGGTNLSIAVTGIAGGLDSTLNSETVTNRFRRIPQTVIASTAITEVSLLASGDIHFALLTNTVASFTNLVSGLSGLFTSQQGTNGGSSLQFSNTMGLVITNGAYTITTNATARDVFTWHTDVTGTNIEIHLLASWADIMTATQQLASVTQPASANLTNWSLYSTNVWNPRQGGSATLTNLAGTGAVTNGQSTDVTLGADLAVPAGGGGSNAWVGGLIWYENGNRTNLNAAAQLTNFAQVIVPAMTLTNPGARLRMEWNAKPSDAGANTNQFVVWFGTNLYDSGLIISNQTAVKISAEIECLDTNSQHYFISVFTRPFGTVAGAIFTNTFDGVLAGNAFIANTFSLQAACRRLGGITNTSARLYFEPGPPR